MAALTPAVLNALPAAGRWALGTMERDALESWLTAARDSGLRTAWLGTEAGFLSNLSLYENLELFHDWQRRPGPFAQDVQHALALMALAPVDWLQARPSQLTPTELQNARLLRLVLLAPDLAIIEPADAGRLLELPDAVFTTALTHCRLLLRGPARADWPALPGPAMLTSINAESPAS